MFYLYGNEDYLIENKIKEIIKNNPGFIVYKFNSEIKINDLINQISAFSLFESNKILVFNNLPYILKSNPNEAKAIINALKFKPKSTIIIFTSENINEKTIKNDFFLYLKENAYCIRFNELSEKELLEFIKTKINEIGASISEIDLIYFLSKLPNKLTVLMNEIEKLVILDKNITKTNIDDCVQKSNYAGNFDFINSIHDENAELMFKTYYEKINQGETIQSFVSQLTNVFELCSKIYSLKKAGLTNNEIEKKLNKHAFVIKKNSEFLDRIGYKRIKELTNSLAELDAKIKQGKIDEKIGFEKFLLEINNY